MAWNIVRHAFVIVFGNFGNALRASLMPLLILIAVVGLLTTVLNLPMNGAIILILVGMAAAMFVFAWVAVTWHRFILLEEYPSFVPAISDRPIWPYVKRTLMIILQMMVVMVPVLSLMLPAISNFPSAAVILSIGLSILMSFIWLRICVSLPSVAVGEHMGSADAWAETKDIRQTILGVCVIMMFLNSAAGLLPVLLAPHLLIISTVLNIAIQWVSIMIGISVLTTIYGHVIEGRPLSGA